MFEDWGWMLYVVAQDQPRWCMSYLNPGKVPKGPSAVTGSIKVSECSIGVYQSLSQHLYDIAK